MKNATPIRNPIPNHISGFAPLPPVRPHSIILCASTQGSFCLFEKFSNLPNLVAFWENVRVCRSYRSDPNDPNSLTLSKRIFSRNVFPIIPLLGRRKERNIVISILWAVYPVIYPRLPNPKKRQKLYCVCTNICYTNHRQNKVKVYEPRSDSLVLCVHTDVYEHISKVYEHQGVFSDSVRSLFKTESYVKR